MTEPTAGQLIEEYLKIRSFKETESKRFSEFMKPWNDRLQAIENELLKRLNEQKLDNFKSDSGTAFKATSMTPKIVPDQREAYIDYCMDHWQDWGNRLLQLRAPQVEAMREYAQEHDGQYPPGTSAEFSTYVNIRKA